MKRRTVLMLGGAAVAVAFAPTSIAAKSIPTLILDTRNDIEVVDQTFRIFDTMCISGPEREIILGFLPPDSFATHAWTDDIFTLRSRTIARAIEHMDQDLWNRIDLLHEIKEHLDHLYGPENLGNNHSSTWGLNKIFRVRTMREMLSGNYADLKQVAEILRDAREHER